jgi:hypothetical protein
MVPSTYAPYYDKALANIFIYLYFILQIWQYFLANSTIASRQGTATDYMITLVKNLKSTHRVDGIPTQFGLTAALTQSRLKFKTWTLVVSGMKERVVGPLGVLDGPAKKLNVST